MNELKPAVQQTFPAIAINNQGKKKRRCLAASPLFTKILICKKVYFIVSPPA
jgi:hypothetical protein